MNNRDTTEVQRLSINNTKDGFGIQIEIEDFYGFETANSMPRDLLS